MDSPRITPLSCCQLVEQWCAAATQNIGTDERISLYATTKIFADYLEFHRACELCDVLVWKFDELKQSQIQKLITWITQETKYEKIGSQEVFTGAFSSIHHLLATITKVKGLQSTIDPAEIISRSCELMRSIPKSFLIDKDSLKIIFSYLRTKDLIAQSKHEVNALRLFFYTMFFSETPDYRKDIAMNCLVERVNELCFKSISEIKEFYGNYYFKLKELDTHYFEGIGDHTIQEISTTFTMLTKLAIKSETVDTHLSTDPFLLVTSLKSLKIQLLGFQSFDFLQNLTNLENLFLKSYNIRDITFLKNLPKLRTISLKLCNALRDISTITTWENFTNVTSLALTGCRKISNFDFLGRFINLTNLNLSTNLHLTDIGFLEPLSKLKKLSLEYCDSITDISLLKNLSKISDLKIRSNKLKLDILQEIPNLTSLSLSGSRSVWTQRDILKSLTKLRSLDLFNCSDRQGLTFLTALTNLTSLDLSGYNDDSFNRLSDLTNLRKLILQCGPSHDYYKLKDLTNLAILHLMSPRWTDYDNFKGLTSIPNLETLNFNPYSKKTDNEVKKLFSNRVRITYTGR